MQQGTNSSDIVPRSSSESTQLDFQQGQGKQYYINNGEPLEFAHNNQTQHQPDWVQPFTSEALKNLLRAAFPGHLQKNAWWNVPAGPHSMTGPNCTINITLSEDTSGNGGKLGGMETTCSLSFRLDQMLHQSSSSSGSVPTTEMVKKGVQEEDRPVVVKQANGKDYGKIIKVYRRVRFPKRERKQDQAVKLKGILKKGKEKKSAAQSISKQKLKVVTFNYKHNSSPKRASSNETPTSQKDLRRSPRIERQLDGYKDKNKLKDARGADSSSSSTAGSQATQASSMGNMFFSFPGPVKFPTLTDLEKCKEPYPEIPATLLQDVATRVCSVPPGEATMELLEAPSSVKEGGASSSKEMKMVTNG